MANDGADPLLTDQDNEPIPFDLEGRWWVAHTRSRAEKALFRELVRAGVYCYLPLRERTTRSHRTRRISRSLVPVFTGYLFFNATEPQRYRAMTTNRIARTLPVPDQREFVGELRQIQRLLTSTNEFHHSYRIGVGQWARVIAGPLQGLEGVVTGKLPRLRLVLNVQMLGQSVSVEVHADDIERIDGPSGPAPGL